MYLICWPRECIIFNLFYFYNNFRYLLSNVVLECNEPREVEHETSHRVMDLI